MMTVFDRIQNFSARQPKPTGLFDISTPEGAFLDRVHNAGFKLIDENGAYTELYTALTCKGNQVINAVAGSGKALRNGTGVFTKLGYKAIETLSIGEFIASDDGLFYPIEGVFPQGFKSLWNMYYEDGNAIPCTADHLWKVSIDYNTGVYTTEQILEKLNAGSLCTIPVTKPVVLGDNVIPNAEAFGKSLANYILYDTDFTFNLDILYSDIDSRQSFFNGFIDALGGNVFEAVEYQLCEWIIYLAESMGYVVTVYEGELGVDRIKIDRDLSERRIVRIEQTNEVCEFTCISVGSPDHIFLTEHFIPTHNTTALTLKVLHDMVTGESMAMKSINGGTPIRVANGIWVCTFLKSGAVELQESLEKWQRKFGYSVTASQVNFSTMDAEFKRVLNAMGVATPIGDTFSCLKKAVDTCNIKRDGNPLSKEDYNIISGILIYYRGRLDQSKYEHPSASDYGLTPTMLDMVARQFALNRQAQGIMDFEEVMEVLYKYLYLQPNAAVQDFISNRYNYIYIDEFQDTSQMAYAILKFYLRGKLALNNNNAVSEDLLYNGVSTLGKAIFVGDISQCIYSFRGSDSTILGESVLADFNPSITALSVNWRCPSNILNPVVQSIYHNEDSAKQVIKSAKEGGVFNALKYPSVKAMCEALKEGILQDLASYHSIAIICRTNFDGLIPALMLESDGTFNFSISGENMTLTSALPRNLVGVACLFTERTSNAVKQALEWVAGRQGYWEVKALMEVLKTNKVSVWQLPEEDLNYSCKSLTPFITAMRKIFMADGVRHADLEVEALKAVYMYLYNEVFAYDSLYNMNARAIIESLMHILDSNNFNSVHEYLEEISFLGDKLTARIKKSGATIKIVTVHEAKGKEYDSVYVWNDSDGIFPTNKCDLQNKSQVAEERRVHYIACTRAKQKLSVLALSGKLGIFAKEMDCEFKSAGVGVISL